MSAQQETMQEFLRQLRTAPSHVRFGGPATAERIEKILKAEKSPRDLSDWDWETTVAAWRYYEYRATICSATFPEEMVRRFFSSPTAWTGDAKMRIATQFADTDHGRSGEKDWKDCSDIDRKPWCKFYNFCNGYAHGFATVRFRSDADFMQTVHETKAFWCDETKRWYPVEKYLEAPHSEIFIPNEWVVEVRRPEVGP